MKTRVRQHALTRAAVAVASVLVPAVVVTQPARAADIAGGRVTLTTANKVVDTRDGTGGVAITPSTDVPLPANAVAAITIFDAKADGRATVHPCGTAPTPPALMMFRAGDVQTDTTTTGPHDCLASTTPINVSISKQGDVSDAPGTGAQYVALAEPTVRRWSTPGSGGWRDTLDIAPPADAVAAVVEVTGRSASSPGLLSFFQCDSTQPPVSVIAVDSSGLSVTLAYVPLASPGDASICFSTSTAMDLVGIFVQGYLRTSGPDPTKLPPTLGFKFIPSVHGFFPFDAPERVLDTREGKGIGGFARKVNADETVSLDLSGVVGIQTRMVSLNVTATEPEGPGFVTVFPCDESRPTASNLNYVVGGTVPNLVVVRVPSSGRVCLYTKARTHLVADVAGTYNFQRGDGVVPVSPVRLLDTREPIGVAAAGKLAAGAVLTLQVAGRGGVPATDATAVTLNVTATDPDNDGYLTVYPCGAQPPTASNVNYVAHQTVPNAVTVGLSDAGTVCIYTQSTTHVIADLSAWFAFGQPIGYRAVAPSRMLDTREAIGVPAAGKLAAGSAIALAVAGHNGVSASGVAAVVLNVTATEPDGPGYVTAYPCDQPRPNASNLNYVANQTVANLVTVKLSASGTVCLFSQRATHLVADVSGFLSTEEVTDWSIGLV